MPDMYCPSCHELNSDGRDRCKKCRMWLPGNSPHLAVGVMLLATAAAGVVTAAYAGVMYCGWARWKREFGVSDPDTPDAEHYADEAAVVIGVVVFAVAAVLAAQSSSATSPAAHVR
jgi:drug/metabolite transporter superfamily protein YnfA